MADKLALPKTKFAHELVAAAVEPTMKAAEATTAKLYRVPVEKIKVIPGFNVRVQSPDYIAHRDEIQQSIATNGYDSTKPLAGYVAKEGDENVIYVTDGHTRLDAVSIHNDDPETDKDAKIKALPVMVHPKEVSLTDLTVALHTSNSGRRLTPYELGVVAKRLLAEEGVKKSDLAKRLSITTRYLDDVLLLANADKAIKQHVVSGAVSPTFAIQALRSDADGAAEKIEAAVSKATKAGKTKATKKDTKGGKTKLVKVQFNYTAGQNMQEIVKAAAKAIREAIPAEEGEDDTKLSTVKGFVSITVEVPVPEAKAKAPAKKPAAKKTAAPKKEAEAEPEAKKPAAKKTTKKPAAKKGNDIGIEGAEPDDDAEEAIMPPKTKSDENVPDDEEVDI